MLVKPLRLIAVAAVAVLVGLVSSGPARAGQIPPGGVPLNWLNASTGYCLGAAGGSMANGTPIIVWPCNGNPDQAWTIQYVSSPDGGLVRNRSNPNKCLSVAGGRTDQGAPLIIWDCKPVTAQDDQVWYVQDNNFVPGCYWFGNDRSHYFMGVAGGSLSQGAPVIQWDLPYWDPHRDQFWCPRAAR